MTIKHLGGVFGRNPTFYNVTIEGQLTFEGDIDVNSDLTVGGDLYVNGEVTSDGIVHTGDTDTFIKFLDNRIYANRGGVRVLDFETNSSKLNSADSVFIQTGTTNRIKVDADGDVSLYEDTGTTAKLFWDASEEALGIGTTSPSTKLDILSDSNSSLVNIARFASNNNAVSVGIGYNEIRQLASANSLNFGVHSGIAMTILDGGNVGIGTDSPSQEFHLRQSSGDCNLLIDSANGASQIFFGDDESVNVGNIRYDHGSNFMRFSANSAEAMRIDSDGNLLVGKTTTGGAYVGVEARANGFLLATRDGDTACYFNRKNSDGTIADFRKDGFTVGTIGTAGDRIYIGDDAQAGISFASASQAVIPCTSSGATNDDAVDLGMLGIRFQDIYATNGTIQTSDRNEKQDIEELSDAEQRVAVAAKGLLRKYRWKSSVADKGDEARIHFGIIAQDLQDAFTAEGLDAGRYGMFINSTWTDEETGEERSRMGVRYDQLLAFIIAAI